MTRIAPVFLAALIFLGSTIPNATGEGVVALGLKKKYELAAAGLAGGVTERRTRLETAYLARLKTIGGDAATKEQTRFVRDRTVPKTSDPPTGDMADLQAVFRREASKLDQRQLGGPAALASAYLFRLCAAGESKFARAEHQRLSASIQLSDAALARTDLSPQADAYVRGATYVTLNYGDRPYLMVRKAPHRGSTRASFLRFDIGSLGRRVDSALLRLVCSENYGSYRDMHTLSLCPPKPTWPEDKICFVTQPKPVETITSWQVPEPRGIIYIDLTETINAQLAKGERSLVLRISSAGTKYTAYGSRENDNAWARPVLMVDDPGAVLGLDPDGKLLSAERFAPPANSGAPVTNALSKVEISTAAPEKTLEVKGSIKQIKALSVSQLASGAKIGLAQPFTATAIKSGGDLPMTIAFNQEVGTDMRTALASVVRGLQLRYGAWPRGYTAEFSFEEKYDPKDGPSAAVACALLLDALVHDTAIDPAFAVTGDLNSDLSVQPVGGVPTKIEGATKRGAKIVCIPHSNCQPLVDMVVLGKLQPLADIAVFTAEHFDQARDLALTDRPAAVQQSLDDFAALQAAGLGSMRSPESIAKLRAILARTPHFLSAELILNAATGKTPKILSLIGSFDAIDTNIAPFIAAMRGGKSKSITDNKFSTTMESLRRVRPKLDPRTHAHHTSLIDLLVFDRRFAGHRFSNDTQYRSYKKEAKILSARYESERKKLTSNPEIMEELLR